MKRIGFLLAAAMACAPASVQTTDSTASAAGDGPSLLVLITVDQLRGDYIDRWGNQLEGGLARLARTGAHFTNAVHDHAITETAPGHASIGSGRFPVNTGIAANSVGVADIGSPLLEGDGLGASPIRYRGTSIADWIAARHPSTRIVSVSAKDRGAILPLGRYRGQVFWYASSGRFVTSTYYTRSLPQWVRQFNARQIAASWAGRTWNLLLPESAYPEPDSVEWESNGRGFLFPYALPAGAAAPASLYTFPFVDELTLSLGLEAVRAQQLGGGSRLDMLAISLSGTDYIGHRWGPDSRELHDQILRLDRSLGAFLDTLFTLVNQERVVIALTSDHGVAPMPELSARGVAPNARRVTFSPLMAELRQWVASVGGDTTALFFGSGALTVNRERLTATGVNLDSLRRRFVAAAREVPGVASVATIAELATRDTVTDHVARRWLHMFRPSDPVVAVVTLEPYSMWSYGAPATHGTPHDYDAHVPIVFWGGPFRQGRIGAPARVVDIAPTLARVIGVRPAERLDGRVLTEALK